MNIKLILFTGTIVYGLLCSASISSFEDAITNENAPPIFSLEKSINLALRAQKPLGNALSAVDLSELNITLAESEFDLKIFPRAEAGYSGGGSAGDGITVGAGVDISKKFLPGTIVTVSPSIVKTGHNYQSNLRFLIAQPLLRGFGSDFTLDNLMGAQYANRTARRNLYISKIRLILQTVQLVYEIAKQDKMLELNKTSLERIRKFHASTLLKQKIGLGDTLNVYRAEIELKHAEDAYNQAVDQQQEAKDSLRDLIGLPADFAFDVQIAIEYHPIDANLKDAVEIALRNRIEMELAEDQVSESTRIERLAKKSMKPELNLVVDYTSLGFDEVFTGAWTGKRENKWGIGFTTSTDFHQVGASVAYQQSIYATQDSKRNVEQVRDGIILEVKRSLRNLKRAREKITLQEEQITNARQEYQFAYLKFQHGYANNFDVIQAEKNLRFAEAMLLAAVIEHKTGEYNFLATIGTLADKPRICR